MPENSAVLARFIDEVWQAGDMAAADEIIHTDFVDRASPLGTVSGADAFKASILGLKKAFPDLDARINDQIEEGDKIAAEWTVAGTHDGELMGIAPTGKSVVVKGMYMYRFADGKLIERSGQADMLGLLRQLGVVST